MANDTNLGFEHKWAFAASPATFGVGSQRFEVATSSLKKQGSVLDGAGLLGTRERREDRTRFGVNRVGGSLGFDVSPRMFDFFLPFILGAAESTDTFNVDDALTGFDVLEDAFSSGTSAIKYNECYVNRFSLALRNQPEILRMNLDVIGKSVTLGQTYTSAALGSTAGVDTPYTFYDSSGGITIRTGSGTIEVEEGELVIDNALDVKFRNSQNAASIRATDRLVTLVTNIPLTASTLSTYFGDKAAADATIVLNNGTVTTTFSLFNLKAPDEGFETSGKGEVPLILRGTARADASDPSIRVTVVGGSL